MHTYGNTMDDKIRRAAKDLLDASKKFREAVNNLYWAQNPEDFEPSAGDPPSVDEATDKQYDAYLGLESAEYYMEKALKK